MKNLILIICLFFAACGEAPLFNDSGDIEINAPVDIAQIPGTNIALVLDINVNLSSSVASIGVIDMQSNTLNVEKSVFFPNFASSVAIDSDRQLVLVGDRANDVVQVFDYDLGSGGIDAFSLTPRNLSSMSSISNGIVGDEEPSGLKIYNDSNNETQAVISNYIDGTLSFLDLNNLEILDLFPEDSRKGLPLIGLTAFDLNANLLGLGAGRIALNPVNERFAYVTSLLNNIIFVVDLWDQEIEHNIILNSYFSGNGLRDLLVDSNERMYFLHQANNSLNKIDVSQISNNNILLEESPVAWLDQVSLPGGADYFTLSPDEQELWVSIYDLNEVWVYDANSLVKLHEISLDGLGPAQLIFSEDTNFVYVCEFLSNSIAVLNTSTYAQVDSVN